LASASVWQLPQFFWKLALPAPVSPEVTRPTAPQPAAPSAIRSNAAA
jgi:hypothetical protein